MYRGFAALVVLALAAPAAAGQDAVARGVTEWSATAAAARGVALLQADGGERYATAMLGWGRVLTDLRGPGWARGRFEWSVEVAPVLAWAPTRLRGVGVAPLHWRWNLEPRGRWHPFAEVGGGALWTTAAIPAGTTSTNFTTHAGLGVRWLRRRGDGLVAGYRLHHISNGNRIRQNPGVNAHMLVVGYTRLAPL